MIIRIFFRPVFSFQLNLNISDEEAVIMKTPITIISIDKIINTFISFPLFRIVPHQTQNYDQYRVLHLPKSYTLINVESVVQNCRILRDLGSGFVYYIVTGTSVYKKRSRSTKMKKLSSKEKILQVRMLKENLKKMKKRKDRKEKNEKEKNEKN